MNELIEPSKRLFLGIPLPFQVYEPLKSFGESYQDLPGLRWTAVKNLHVTVFFFGNVEVEMIENLISLIRLGLKKSKPFDLEFDRYCLAPRPDNPRMIWARYKKAEAFKQLVEDMNRLYEQIAPKQQNRKNPIPHITMARLKGFDLDTKIDFQRHLPPKETKIKEVILWESELRPEGAHYKVVERFRL